MLGSVLLTPDLMPYLAADLKAWYFSNVRYRLMFKALSYIDVRGEVIDVPTLFNELKSNPEISGKMQFSYQEITKLIEGMPAMTYPMLTQSIRRIKETANLRYILKLNNEIARRIKSGEHGAADITRYMNECMDKLTVETGTNQDFRSFAQMSTDMSQLYKDLHEGKVVATSTGFDELDAILAWGGIVPQSASILAAHTSFGKTALALDMAKRIAQQEKEVAIFSLEMSAESLFMRVHSNISELESHKIRPFMSEKERDILMATIQDMKSLPIHVNDRTNDLIEMRAKLRTWSRTHKNIGAVFVDYLQLIDTGSNKREEQERERISEVSRKLKQMASEFNVPLIELSQFSRQSYKDGVEPQISDLYGSGSIEKDADNVWLLHGEKPDTIITTRELEFIVAKQRMGRLGRFGMTFDTSRNRFTSHSGTSGNGSSGTPVAREIVHELSEEHQRRVAETSRFIEGDDHEQTMTITDESGESIF